MPTRDSATGRGLTYPANWLTGQVSVNQQSFCFGHRVFPSHDTCDDAYNTFQASYTLRTLQLKQLYHSQGSHGRGWAAAHRQAREPPAYSDDQQLDKLSQVSACDLALTMYKLSDCGCDPTTDEPPTKKGTPCLFVFFFSFQGDWGMTPELPTVLFWCCTYHTTSVPHRCSD